MAPDLSRDLGFSNQVTPAESASMIEIQGLRKLYDDYLAVDDMSFTLRQGQICGLVGPNGAGKTTTLRCMAGLIRATEGLSLIHI